MKWIFVAWLAVLFISLLFWGYRLIRLIIKTKNWFKLCWRLILKYLLYLLLCLMPTSIIAGLINIENSIVYLIILSTINIVFVGVMIMLRKQDKGFLWFMLFPILPSIVFHLMTLEIQKEAQKISDVRG